MEADNGESGGEKSSEPKYSNKDILDAWEEFRKMNRDKAMKSKRDESLDAVRSFRAILMTGWRHDQSDTPHSAEVAAPGSDEEREVFTKPRYSDQDVAEAWKEFLHLVRSDEEVHFSHDDREPVLAFRGLLQTEWEYESESD